MGKYIRLGATITTAIASALGLTIALFWRDAIKELIDYILIKFPIGSGWIFSFIVAIIVTIICSIGIWIISRGKQN